MTTTTRPPVPPCAHCGHDYPMHSDLSGCLELVGGDYCPCRAYEQQMELALPYAGTSGWSGSETSRERAETADTDGTTEDRQATVRRLLDAAAERGLTWKDLADLTGWHHGTASGALSVLHKVGLVARLTERRDKCAVYVLPRYTMGRETAPHGRKTKPRLTPADLASIDACTKLVRSGVHVPPAHVRQLLDALNRLAPEGTR